MHQDSLTEDQFETHLQDLLIAATRVQNKLMKDRRLAREDSAQVRRAGFVCLSGTESPGLGSSNSIQCLDKGLDLDPVCEFAKESAFFRISSREYLNASAAFGLRLVIADRARRAR